MAQHPRTSKEVLNSVTFPSGLENWRMLLCRKRKAHRKKIWEMKAGRSSPNSGRWWNRSASLGFLERTIALWGCKCNNLSSYMKVLFAWGKLDDLCWENTIFSPSTPTVLCNIQLSERQPLQAAHCLQLNWNRGSDSMISIFQWNYAISAVGTTYKKECF